jgi:hypothetical protein
MSVRCQQHNSLLRARSLLREILNRPLRSWTAKEIKAKSDSALKHFPQLEESGKPVFSDDDFED